MSSYVHIQSYSYTHSVTYVTENLLRSLKEIIRQSGLSPENFVGNWGSNERAFRTWLGSRDLERVTLEVYRLNSDALVARWDFDITYGAAGDGGMWVDTDDIRFHIKKAGLWPNECQYELKLLTNPGRPDVTGWTNTSYRSTDGMLRQSMGTTIDGNGLQAGGAYWRQAQ